MSSEGFELFKKIKRSVSKKIHREKLTREQIKILLTQNTADLLGSIEDSEIKGIETDYHEMGNKLFTERGLFGCKVEIINDKNSDKNWFDVVEIDEAQEI